MVDAKQFSDAVWSGDLESVNAFIANGADVNAAESPRKPPLYLAIEQQWVEVVRCLINAGADINRSLGGGWTPLVHAIDTESDAAWQRRHLSDHASTELTAMLLEAGASPTDLAVEVAEGYENQKALGLLVRYERSTGRGAASERGRPIGRARHEGLAGGPCR